MDLPTVKERNSLPAEYNYELDDISVVYGRPRVGKTRAIHYISKKLKEKYGEDLSIYVITVTDHKPSEKYLYVGLMQAIELKDPDKGTVPMMKDRLLSAFTYYARETLLRRIVLFIDEAFFLTEKDFIWLMDIHNNLDMKNIHLTVLLFGTEELKNIKSLYCRSKRNRIVARFMVEEYEYKGISSANDAMVCLTNMDKALPGYPGDLILTQLFFPSAYADKERLGACANALWDAFVELNEKNNTYHMFSQKLQKITKIADMFSRKLHFANSCLPLLKLHG